MNNKVGEGEKQGRHAIRMFRKFITLEKSIEDKVRVRQSCNWGEVGRGNGTGIWRASLADAGNEGIVVGAISCAIGVVNMFGHLRDIQLDGLKGRIGCLIYVNGGEEATWWVR